MLLRLRDIKNDMEINNSTIEEIKDRRLFKKADWHAIEQTLLYLGKASARCKEANRLMLDMTSRYHQLYILGGCYGRRVDI